ncbi:hypothetical protein KHQ08_07030 [Pseudochrobactrum algeriensis]|uniref:Uncharacterized protein n=1 Tax=Pseudochrobactrum saccharolyticum TaxID=354352 RepID=A0A7W8AK31_9HYPH|nr:MULTISPECIES: hypothetical protein [Pseudochrobactrum]MBX8785260.1 hypothetical protein [Ochrobactrum sp. GRS2]MBX8813320.1 hypothetical protein [Ochrobactrum sp. MR34]HWD14169.1 hypothetical protein [Pseudochrobactrum sp.]KAB0538063.1 hypothetical protein F7P81_10055 [Pseudochrobactrum saccharolyticum]MBB5091284.1 hypothetical protein [Pseudochrobactrum saccharolyticum]
MRMQRFMKWHLSGDDWIVMDCLTGEEAFVGGVKYGALIEVEAERYAETLNWLHSYAPLNSAPWIYEEPYERE